MMRGLFAGALALAGLAAMAQAQTGARPPITGISHIAVYAADAAASERFYTFTLGAEKRPDPENPGGARYYFSRNQFVEVLPLVTQAGISRLAHVAFVTADAAALRRYMVARRVKDVSAVEKAEDGSLWFSTRDPEGNEVRFVQPPEGDAEPVAGAISGRVIHVGFLVHNRANEDSFYREILGFRPYWFGAMREGATDWVSQQVPDGRDWLEYMMVGEGSTVPVARVDMRQLGVLNHFSLGVENMEAAVTKLIGEERLSPRHDGPSMGRDGKWQANLYDPDGTRVELMEFQPVVKPCCSAFTAESPAK